MMKLVGGGASPFVRKVRLTAGLKGLDASITAAAGDEPGMRELNPLGKVPVLVLDNGKALYDSQVICEYLDSLAPAPVLFPHDNQSRWDTLTLGAMGDGILEAALLLVYEGRYRPGDKRVESWVDMQQEKIDTAVASLEAAPPEWGQAPDYGHLTIACALGYLDFRHEGKWRAGNPNMVEWLSRFAQAVPSFDETTPEA